MKLITHWLFITILWIALTGIAFSLYIKLDWDNTLEKYEEDFKSYRIEKKRFKMMFRRVPSPDNTWRYKYLTEDTKKAFNDNEIKCLQDEESCAQEQRNQLCDKLKSLPKINDCKSIKRMRDEFVAMNKYMDQKIPPQKPRLSVYKETNKTRHIIFALIITIPPILFFLFRRKFYKSN